MPRLYSIRPALTLKGRSFKGVRGWAGKPSHPPFTDFPIAAYVFAAAFDVISYFAVRGQPASQVSSLGHDAFAAGTYVIMAGAVFSLAAALTGFWDWWKGIDRDKGSGWLGKAKHTQVWRTINWHATIMLTVTAIVIVDVVVRLTQYGKGYTQLGTMILSVVAAGLVAFGAAYGGSLVYDYQFNVESLEGSTVWDESEQDQLPGQHSSSEW
jgi:uncharacterized membrane protein